MKLSDLVFDPLVNVCFGSEVVESYDCTVRQVWDNGLSLPGPISAGRRFLATVPFDVLDGERHDNCRNGFNR